MTKPKTFNLGFAFAIAVLSSATFAMGTARATPLATAGKLGRAADRLSLVEQTQFIFEDKEYCWYESGWNGPGWYLCGYNMNRGSGYGGPSGWHDWDRNHPPHRVHGPGSSHNPIVNQPQPSSPVVWCTINRVRVKSPACGGKPKPKPVKTRKPTGLPPGTLIPGTPPVTGTGTRQGPPGSGPAPRPGGKTK